MVTDNKKCSYQGLTDTKVSNFIRDLRKMVPDQFHKYTGWDHTRTEQGTWPSKTFVNMQFKNETNLATIIGLPEIVKEEIKKGPYKLHGQEVSARLEMSPKGSQRRRTQWVQERGGKFRSASLSEVQWLQNTLPEREGLAWPGISNLMLYRILWNTFRGNCQIKLTEESHFQTQSWPLISAHVNRQRSLDIFTMKEKLLGPALARTQTSTILTIQETKSSWNWLDTCVTVANLGSQRCWCQINFAQSRDHGTLKSGVQRFPSEPLWWWQYMLQTQARVWRCSRTASRASLKYFEKDVGEEPQSSTL